MSPLPMLQSLTSSQSTKTTSLPSCSGCATQFISTPFVFAEVHATFSRSPTVREQIIADFWENPLLHMAEVSQADHRAAIALLRQHDDKSYPFCDAISFVIMERLEVNRAGI